MTLQLEIITPEKVVYSDTADQVTLPTRSGEITLLPNHVPILSQLSSGELTIIKDERETSLAISGGFVQVENNKVSILADYAIRSEHIELAKAEEAKKRAEKVMAEKVSEKDFAEAEAIFQRAILELKIGTKRRRHSLRNTPTP